MASTSPLVVSSAAGRSGPPRDVQRRAVFQLRATWWRSSPLPLPEWSAPLCGVTRVPHHRVASTTAASSGPPGLAHPGTPAHPPGPEWAGGARSDPFLASAGRGQKHPRQGGGLTLPGQGARATSLHAMTGRAQQVTVSLSRTSRAGSATAASATPSGPERAAGTKQPRQAGELTLPGQGARATTRAAMTGRAQQVYASRNRIQRAGSDQEVVILGGWPPADLSEIQTQRTSLKGIHLHLYNQV
jgi:hypothetical protein